MKLFLIMPMAIIELLLIGLCWIIAFIHPATAKKIIYWSIENFPGKDWYQ